MRLAFWSIFTAFKAVRSQRLRALSLLLLAACSAYDPALITRAKETSLTRRDSGVSQVDAGSAADAATVGDAATAADAGTLDAAVGAPGCVANPEDPLCPLVCPESCNGLDDDCDGRTDEIDARSTCWLPHATSVCMEAACLVAACANGYADCNGLAEDGCEAALDSVDHCGGCGSSCDVAHATAACTDSNCLPKKCDPLYGDCDGDPSNGCETSVDTLTDCGACGARCAMLNGSTDCVAGGCLFQACAAGWADCNHDASALDQGDGCETQLGTPQNCGACGQACSGSTPYCAGGKCSAISCASGTADCDGDTLTCETDLNSLTNCGTCGMGCGNVANADASCAAGACSATCKSGYKSCDGTLANGCETDIHTTTNCGDCAAGCKYANATTACSTGACQLGACNAGYGDCNGNVALDGCEQRLNTLTHCSQCNKACSLANAAATCSSGTCQVSTCSAGFANCDGNGSNGCEANIKTSTQHCGSCSNVCPANLSCVNGQCLCTADANCASGQACCGGRCVDTHGDANNCGACGVACGGGQTCCSGSCKNTSTDVNNCGGCGTRCDSKRSNECAGGSCGCSGSSACSSSRICCSRGCEFGFFCF